MSYNPNISSDQRHKRIRRVGIGCGAAAATTTLLLTGCTSSTTGQPGVSESLASAAIALDAQSIAGALSEDITQGAGRIKQTSFSDTGSEKIVQIHGIPLDTSELTQKAAAGYADSTGVLELRATYARNGDATSASITQYATCGHDSQKVEAIALSEQHDVWSANETPNGKTGSAALGDEETLFFDFREDFASVSANNGMHAITLHLPAGMSCGAS